MTSEDLINLGYCGFAIALGFVFCFHSSATLTAKIVVGIAIIIVAGIHLRNFLIHRL